MEAFETVLKNVAKDETVQYVLALLEDMLDGAYGLGSLWKAWEPSPRPGKGYAGHLAACAARKGLWQDSQPRASLCPPQMCLAAKGGVQLS